MLRDMANDTEHEPLGNATERTNVLMIYAK